VPDTPVFWDVWVQGILELLGGRLRVVIDQRKPE